jgi:hypothetical protein
MPVLVVAGPPPDVLRSLELEAERKAHTVEEEALALIEEGLAARRALLDAQLQALRAAVQSEHCITWIIMTMIALSTNVR